MLLSLFLFYIFILFAYDLPLTPSPPPIPLLTTSLSPLISLTPTPSPSTPSSLSSTSISYNCYYKVDIIVPVSNISLKSLSSSSLNSLCTTSSAANAIVAFKLITAVKTIVCECNLLATPNTSYQQTRYSIWTALQATWTKCDMQN